MRRESVLTPRVVIESMQSRRRSNVVGRTVAPPERGVRLLRSGGPARAHLSERWLLCYPLRSLPFRSSCSGLLHAPMSPPVAGLETASTFDAVLAARLPTRPSWMLAACQPPCCSTMVTSVRGFPLIVHWKVCWPRATVRTPMIHAGMAGLGLGTVRGNELAMANGASSRAIHDNHPLCWLSGVFVMFVCVVPGHVKDGGSDGSRHLLS